MKIYPTNDDLTNFTSFEIDSIFVTISGLAKRLKSIEQVTDVRKRRLFSKWDEVHIRFTFCDTPWVVWEPFGDNSRYWIGPDMKVLGEDVAQQPKFSELAKTLAAHLEK